MQETGPRPAINLTSQPLVCRRPDFRIASRRCAVRAIPYRPTESSRLYLEVLESGKRLADALAEERKTNKPKVQNPENTAQLERWTRARSEVARAVEYYALSLENFREAVLTEVAPLLSRRSQ